MSRMLLSHALLREEASFAPLFRLLEGFDTYSPHTPAAGQNRMRTFVPKFDMMETDKSYELHGEFPGIDKNDLSIDFAEPQTVVIKGSVERRYEAGTRRVDGRGGSPRPVHATVEDADKAGNEKEKQVVRPAASRESNAEKAGARYWVSERSVGDFSRSFSFPAPVDQEAVTASLKDGILNLSIPKAKKTASRRIMIN